MCKDLKPRDKVAWDTAQGTPHGKVVKKLTTTTRIRVTSPRPGDDPQYLVQSDKTDAKAAHKPGALKRKS